MTTVHTTKKTANLDINSVGERLEQVLRDGFFAQPQNLSNVWCHLTDEGCPVDLAVLGDALFRLWEAGDLTRTVPVDGLMHYVDTTNAGLWRGIDAPGRGTTAAGIAAAR